MSLGKQEVNKTRLKQQEGAKRKSEKFAAVENRKGKSKVSKLDGLYFSYSINCFFSNEKRSRVK